MTMTPWTELGLFDSDGCTPEPDELLKLLREYRADESISDYYLVDPTDGREGPRGWEVRDPYHNNEWRDHWDAGPTVAEIDWTGFPGS